MGIDCKNEQEVLELREERDKVCAISSIRARAQNLTKDEQQLDWLSEHFRPGAWPLRFRDESCL